MTLLEPTLSKISENIHKRSPRAEAPLCEAQSFPRMESVGNATLHHYCLKNETECEIQMRTRFCEAILRERIRKTETNVFEIRKGFWFGFRRVGRCGR